MSETARTQGKTWDEVAYKRPPYAHWQQFEPYRESST